MTTETIPAALKFKTQPYRHQLDCLNKFGRTEYFALLAEQGTGKTWIIINNIADLWANEDCDTVLVLAPNGVQNNWTRLELPAHMPEWVRYRAQEWSPVQTKRNLQKLNNLFLSAGSGELRILAMNWEALQTDRGFAFAEKFACSGRRLMIVADESDAMKNPSALRTKRLMKLRKYSHWRRIMTGTPINNAPFDAYSQFNFLDEDILGTTSFYAFKAEYAEMLGSENRLVRNIQRSTGRAPQIVARRDGRPVYRNLDKLAALIAPYSFRVLKEDCLDLPKKIYKTLVFEMTPQQKAAYRIARDECRIIFEGDTTPFSKLVAVTKLSQITSGYFLHPAATEPVRIPGDNPKLDILVERVCKLAEQGKKTIVWARFRVEIADIVERLKAEKLKVVEYHGGVKRGDRITAIEDFTNADAEVFVGNQQAGGRGITLVSSHNVIYFSNDFSLRNRAQSEDRAHRIGQEEDVTYYNIVAKNTIDEKVIRTLTNKQDIADAILNEGTDWFDATAEEEEF